MTVRAAGAFLGAVPRAAAVRVAGSDPFTITGGWRKLARDLAAADAA